MGDKRAYITRQKKTAPARTLELEHAARPAGRRRRRAAGLRRGRRPPRGERSAALTRARCVVFGLVCVVLTLRLGCGPAAGLARAAHLW
jgi:hypothetical protein